MSLMSKQFHKWYAVHTTFVNYLPLGLASGIYYSRYISTSFQTFLNILVFQGPIFSGEPLWQRKSSVSTILMMVFF